MYKLIYIVSFILRNLYGPSLFKYLPNGEGLDSLFGVILMPVTYLMVGTFYRKGSSPAFGSIAFLVMYFVNGFVFQQIMRLYPIWWLLVIVSVVYVVLFICLVNKIKFPD